MGRKKKQIKSGGSERNKRKRIAPDLLYDDRNIYLMSLNYQKGRDNLSVEDTRVLDNINVRLNIFENSKLLRKRNGVISTKVFAKGKKADRRKEEQ